MNKLLVVCGPTATGKTSIALSLAKKFNGELICADSRQIYKGMDIGTGKDIPGGVEFKDCSSKFKVDKNRFTVGNYDFEGIALWLYDVVLPSQEFSVADYYLLCLRVVKDIWQRGKMPILVGGTGFYIKSVV